LFIDRVEGIEKGLYRYLPKEQKIIGLNASNDVADKLNNAMCNQLFGAAVVFLWAVIPYKMEYAYMEVSHKMIAIEAGHVCQNLYLAAESINCGCCAISAYYQDEIDDLLGIDGENEFVIYIGTVGKYKM
jgi:SagB-type dehydrogenase family enzyme